MKAKKKVNLDADDQLVKLAVRIKALRMERGYTSYEYFAYDHDISRAQYGRYEKGQDIRFSSLIKLINAFDISIEEFFSTGFE
ncbi:MAG: helix-turn-helix transcriptional regulator [Bacteroidetes bacterium]|nr:helix-turn-helix transcriptional regulator [Bacteroidota bacterium]MBS1670005.1 helix-turn-helix transcriptional regulator [Bacteroidota bacterium]